MRTVQLHGPGDLRIDEVDEHQVDEGMVRVDIEYTGICGSDLHEYKIGPVPIRAEDSDHEIPESEWDDYLPKPMGHEIAGTISEVGSGVEGFAEGDRVAFNLSLGCGECRYCAVGKYNLCKASDGAVVNSAGFSDNMIVPAAAAVPIPDGLSMRHAALAEPLGVSLRGVQRSEMQPGDNVAVFGAGPIGLGVVAGAKAAGANEIYVSEPLEARREAAVELGADTALNPLETDVRQQIRDETDGVDVAFECAGISRTLTDSLRCTKYDGNVIVLSVFEDEASIHPNDIMQAERKLIGSFGYNGGPRADNSAFHDGLQLMANGQIDPEPLITDTVSLDEVDDAFQALLADDSEQIKVLVQP
jgi:(R,R)-butanediol dehydrogenase/meso-butanediol dehydrogenase/diacetyl reductase